MCGDFEEETDARDLVFRNKGSGGNPDHFHNDEIPKNRIVNGYEAKPRHRLGHSLP